MKSTNLVLECLLMMVAMTAVTVANAHSLEKKAIAFHGGVVQNTESFNLEVLLVQKDTLRLYVRDRRNRPLGVKDGYATALIWGEGNTEEVLLKPVDLGAFEGQYQVAAVKRVIVTLHMPGRESEKAWLTGFSKSSK